MAEVKPAEVSAILREQLAGLKTEAELQELADIVLEENKTSSSLLYGMKGNFSWWRSGFACSALLADVFCRTGREEEKRQRQKKKEEEG